MNESHAELISEIADLRRKNEMLLTDLRERTRELEDEKLRYQQSCYGRAAFMEELNALRIELEAERSRREAAEKQVLILQDIRSELARKASQLSAGWTRADSLALEVDRTRGFEQDLIIVRREAASLARDLAAVHQRNECLKHDAETDRAMFQKHMARAERSEAERDALLHEFRECRTCNLGGDLCERSNRLEKERDNLAQRVADLTEQLTAYAVQYGNAALSQPKAASKEKEK